jgi:NAD(P)-dependent dehydrogenase (short-subunit alcohol dehydrogenase family)
MLPVINNAGIAAAGVTEAYTIEQFQQVFEVNLLGVVRVNRAVLPAMRHQRRGLLIYVSSGIGRSVVPGFAACSASKFALEALADAYRFELAPLGIDSIIVTPLEHTILSGQYPGAKAPLVLGNEGAGVVEEGGGTEFPIGSRVMFTGRMAFQKMGPTVNGLPYESSTFA